MRRITGKGLLLGLAFVSGLVEIGAGVQRASAGIRFTIESISLEPDTEFLKLRFHGGQTREVRSYTLFGDGRVSIFASRHVSATPKLVASGRLSDAELSKLVDQLLQSGLTEFNREEIRTRQRQELRRGPTIKDAGSVEIEIHLPFYPGTSPDGIDEIKHAFAVSGSDLAEGSFPGIQEYTALRDIVKTIRRAEASAAASGVAP